VYAIDVAPLRADLFLRALFRAVRRGSLKEYALSRIVAFFDGYSAPVRSFLLALAFFLLRRPLSRESLLLVLPRNYLRLDSFEFIIRIPF